MQLSQNKIMVSVYMITYNHENFIEQAINSVLSQKVDFNYKLFIGDDCSTDNTTEICLSYKEKFPELIELYLQESNIGASSNAKEIIQRCLESDSTYIATLEGDDYWVDPYKLQKQVDLLRSKKEIALCVHQTKMFKSSKFVGAVTSSSIPEGVYGFNDVLNNYNGLAFHTSSFVFRKDDFDLAFFLTNTWPGGDLIIILNLLKKGKIFYFKEVSSVYRLHSGGVSQKVGSIEKQLAYYEALKDSVSSFKTFYGTKYSEEINHFIKGLKFYLAELNYQLHRRKQCREYFREAIFWRADTFKERNFRTIIALFLYCYLPPIFGFNKQK